MYNYLAILEDKEVSRTTLKKYFKDNDIKLEKVYTSIGVIKLVSFKKLTASKLKYITNLELDTKEYKIANTKNNTE